MPDAGPRRQEPKAEPAQDAPVNETQPGALPMLNPAPAPHLTKH